MNKKLIIPIAISVAIVLFGILLYHLHHAPGSFITRTLGFVVQSLASRSGISLYAVWGAVIIATIPFFWAVGKYSHGKFLFWLHGVSPSLHLYQNVYGIIIVSYVGIFFIAMFLASKEAYAYKWCADTPEGIKTFDGPGKDPVYGIEAKPCSFEQIVKIRESTHSNLGTKRIEVGDAKDFVFFDPVTGTPRVWYYKLADGSFQFFDRPGRYPGTGEDLVPVNRATVQELVQREAAQEANAQRSQTEARQQLEEQNQVRQRQDRDAFAARYINTAITKRSGAKQVAILVLTLTGEPTNGIESILASAATNHGLVPVEDFFSPSFVTEGRARNLFQGDWAEASRLSLKSHIDYVIFANSRLEFTSSAQFEGLISSNLHVQLKCLDLSAQKSCGHAEVDSVGAGYSKEASTQNAITKSQPQIETFVVAVGRG